MCAAVRPVAGQSASPAGQPVEQEKTLGPVRLRLVPDRQQMGLADTLTLTLTVVAPPGVGITLPEVPTRLGPFEVTRQRTTGPTSLDPQRQQWQREYSLMASDAGNLSLPALVVEVQEGETRQPLHTDPLPITVTSVVPADADPATLKDIAPPVTLVRHGAPPWVGWAALGLACLLPVAVAWWWWQRRRHTRDVPLLQRPAHELALAALNQLQGQELIQQGHIEAFYVRLSTITRRYVELRFGLRAPEQTTEEFLTTVLHTGGLLRTHRDLLEAFLRHCDLVKFAQYRPTRSAMEDAFASAKIFITQTADTQVLITIPESGEEVL